MALSLREQVLRRKPVAAMNEDSGTDSGGGELSRSIGLFQLSMFGIGATIGTGIFIVLTQAVPVAGPAVIWSFVIAGTVAGLTAICYAELASAVPVSGSSYSYAYATLGEGVAVVVAACLLLEYGVAAAAVAVGWSQYLNQLLDNLFGFPIPENLSNAPEAGGILNLPAVVLIVLCTLLLIRGASESAKVNAVMVLIKLGVLVLFIAVGLQGWDSDNLSDFSPFGARRRHVGRRDHLLLLHRPRRGLDRGRGGQEPAADDAAGDHHRPGHRDHGLHRGRRGRRRRPADGGVRGPRGRAGGDPRGRHGRVVALDRARRRRRDLDLQRDAGEHLRPDADPVRDGPRRDDPVDLPQGEPAHADAGAGDDHRRRHRLAAGRRCCRSTSWPR